MEYGVIVEDFILLNLYLYTKLVSLFIMLQGKFLQCTFINKI